LDYAWRKAGEPPINRATQSVTPTHSPALRAPSSERSDNRPPMQNRTHAPDVHVQCEPSAQHTGRHRARPPPSAPLGAVWAAPVVRLHCLWRGWKRLRVVCLSLACPWQFWERGCSLQLVKPPGPTNRQPTRSPPLEITNPPHLLCGPDAGRVEPFFAAVAHRHEQVWVVRLLALAEPGEVRLGGWGWVEDWVGGLRVGWVG